LLHSLSVSTDSDQDHAFSPILDDLNPEQLEAVLSDESPLVVVAGPGTGKTRVLVSRIAHLLSQGTVKADEVIAVTFTNKSAREIEERLDTIVGTSAAKPVKGRGGVRCPESLEGYLTPARPLWKPTVRTFHGLAMDILPPVDLLSEERQTKLLMDAAGLKRAKAERMLERISLLKQHLVYPENQDKIEDPEVLRTYRAYETARKETGLLDIDDLIPDAVRLLKQDADALSHWRARSRCLAIDEFQDVNLAQYELVKILKPDGQELMVIGDPDQAIYGWRGADRTFFLKLQEDFPTARRVALHESYRSTPSILQASSEMLSHGQCDDPSMLRAVRRVDNAPVKLLRCLTDRAEAELVAHRIERMVGGTSFFSMDSGRLEAGDAGGRVFGDIAVLCRTGRVMEPLVEAFSRLGIPFSPSRKGADLSRPIVEAMLDKAQALQGMEIAPAEALSKLLEEDPTFRKAEKDDRRALKELSRLAAISRNASELRDRVVLARISEEASPESDKVSLLTLHAAKGLEFRVVFVTGCEEGLIPLRHGRKEDSDIDEERRLFYVGMTRAMDELVLTWAAKRSLQGRDEERRPSRFLDGCVAIVREDGFADRPHKPRGRQLDLL